MACFKKHSMGLYAEAPACRQRLAAGVLRAPPLLASVAAVRNELAMGVE